MYDNLSTYYDRFVNWENRLQFEIPFIEKVLSQISAKGAEPIRVLDSASGTAMHAIALAKRGYACAAADLSAEMIQQAQKNSMEHHVQIQGAAVGLGEMTSVFGEQAFDAVLCLGNSIPHLITEQQFQKAMQDFYHLLSKGGVLIIQNRNFEPVLAKQIREMEPQAYSDSTRDELYIRFYDFLANGLIQFNFITCVREKAQSWSQSWNSSLLKPYRKNELEPALQQVGFKDLQYFGSLAGEPYDPAKSGNLVIVAWRKI